VREKGKDKRRGKGSEHGLGEMFKTRNLDFGDSHHASPPGIKAGTREKLLAEGS
jgi:hypothetical protein